MGLDITCKCRAVNFRAGSYSSYNHWREILAKIAGIPDLDSFWEKAGSVHNRNGSEPFFELINFSDCEGTLPYVECKRLLEDFDLFGVILHRKSSLFWTKIFTNLEIDKITFEYWLKKFDLWHQAMKHAVFQKCDIIFC